MFSRTEKRAAPWARRREAMMRLHHFVRYRAPLCSGLTARALPARVEERPPGRKLLPRMVSMNRAVSSLTLIPSPRGRGFPLPDPSPASGRGEFCKIGAVAAFGRSFVERPE